MYTSLVFTVCRTGIKFLVYKGLKFSVEVRV